MMALEDEDLGGTPCGCRFVHETCTEVLICKYHSDKDQRIRTLEADLAERTKANEQLAAIGQSQFDRIRSLEAALKEATEWDWLSAPEDIPEKVQKQVMETLYPLLPFKSETNSHGENNG